MPAGSGPEPLVTPYIVNYPGAVLAVILCQSYIWQSTENAFSTSITYLQQQWKNTQTGETFLTNFTQNCISIPNYKFPNTPSSGSVIFNGAWNYATTQTDQALDDGIIAPNASAVQQYMQKIVRSQLSSIAPGYSWTLGGVCAGNVPVNEISNTSWCAP